MPLILPEHLGPDPVGRGAENWRKSNVALRCSQVLHDMAAREGVSMPELFGGMVESLIAFIQATGNARREVAQATTDEIMRRMTAR